MSYYRKTLKWGKLKNYSPEILSCIKCNSLIKQNSYYYFLTFFKNAEYIIDANYCSQYCLKINFDTLMMEELNV